MDLLYRKSVFKFDSIMRKNGFNFALWLPQQCLKIGVRAIPGMKPGSNRNETATGMKPSRLSNSLETFLVRHGHYDVTTVRKKVL